MNEVVTILVDNIRIETDDLELTVNEAIRNGAKLIKHVNGIIIYDLRNNQHLSRAENWCKVLDLCVNSEVTIWFYKLDGDFRVLSGRYEGGNDSGYYTLNLKNNQYRRIKKDSIVDVTVSR